MHRSARAAAYLSAALLILVDEFIKFWLFFNLKRSVDFKFLFLKFTYVENRGIAFGVFKRDALSLCLIFFVVLFFLRSKLFDNVPAIFMVAGAFGNLIDRISYGFVIDYISLSFLPIVFNISDISIFFGTLFVALSYYLCRKKFFVKR
ncbi:MAG: signal peptidase II [Oscillospiraceae bacterium]|nr:signal peptidase II [Oscillospiraceae bacterium]